VFDLLICIWQVDMEQDYVTAAFFRHAIAQRQQHLQQLEDMQQIMDGACHACLHPPICNACSSLNTIVTLMTVLSTCGMY
jgi:hypothetical protein